MDVTMSPKEREEGYRKPSHDNSIKKEREREEHERSNQIKEDRDHHGDHKKPSREAE
jgi:hypothetical protein